MTIDKFWAFRSPRNTQHRHRSLVESDADNRFQLKTPVGNYELYRQPTTNIEDLSVSFHTSPDVEGIKRMIPSFELVPGNQFGFLLGGGLGGGGDGA